jgi:3-deoxy-D-manno-octulosonate 8-phosphate phosphatase (KDO 8-P phosphatase)
MTKLPGFRHEVVPNWKPSVFLLDVDGVMTNGQFLYSAQGKGFKVFGPDDHDALLLLKPHVEIGFITGDRKGLPITTKRIVDDMKMPLDLVSTVQRLAWIRERWEPKDVAYMGDGIFDPWVFAGVGYSIAPSNGFHTTRARAHHVTVAAGGDRAVAEACLHLMERFFTPFDPDTLPERFASSGEWGI